MGGEADSLGGCYCYWSLRVTSPAYIWAERDEREKGGCRSIIAAEVIYSFNVELA